MHLNVVGCIEMFISLLTAAEKKSNQMAITFTFHRTKHGQYLQLAQINMCAHSNPIHNYGQKHRKENCSTWHVCMQDKGIRTSIFYGSLQYLNSQNKYEQNILNNSSRLGLNNKKSSSIMLAAFRHNHHQGCLKNLAIYRKKKKRKINQIKKHVSINV